ncbi:MAG: phosphoglycerate dehydrogenase [Candidatus Omnitrophica bacterium]|nr:phosphoglycerate dehydrogenase [Candidatus Omnitrophota bacterium]MDD5488842.1 phosphoglycerate dehydrogenase [Candidatus Omnitrophota bacterium]
MKIFISTSTFAEKDTRPLDVLKENGMEYDMNPHRRKLTAEEIAGFLASDAYDGLIAGTETLGRRALEGAGRLKVISRVGVGTDNIDAEVVKERGIMVLNTPGVLTDAVAELTLGLILSCLRRIPLADRNIRTGRWEKPMGNLLKNRTVGVIGFGQIGRRVATLCRAFGARVIFHDMNDVGTDGFEKVPLDTLLKISDIMTVHVSTKDIIFDTGSFGKVKPGAIIVNTSRGTVIDEDALFMALEVGRISFAGLDVFGEEPYKGKLTECANTVLTPHIGSYAEDARIEMELAAVKNLVNGLKGRR